MKFIHLADLHLGKRVNGFSMLEDQKYVLEQVLETVAEEKADGVFLSGDIYDKQIPPVEAVRLCDDFLTRLAGRHVPVYLIGGNHDSAERLSFGARLMSGSGIYLSPAYDGNVARVTVSDGYGPLDIWLLPFFRPAQVRAVWGEEAEEIRTCQEALAFVLGRLPLDKERRNVLLAHQFVSGGVVCDSEEHAVGGLEQVDAADFADFDYVALGHLHKAQHIGTERVRYAGTLLKYSFSEVGNRKSITVVELREKGNVEIRERPVRPLHEMRGIRGSYAEVTSRANYENTDTQDYVRITLTDEEDIFDAAGKLRSIYPNLMQLDYDNVRTRMHQSVAVSETEEEKDPLTLAEELFVLQNNKPMSDGQREYLRKLARTVWEEER